MKMAVTNRYIALIYSTNQGPSVKAQSSVHYCRHGMIDDMGLEWLQ